MERNDSTSALTDGSSISLHEFLYPLLQLVALFQVRT